MPGFRAIKVGLIATIVAFAAAASYVSFLISERQAFLLEVSRYNMVWAASQALTEFHRFEYRVAAFAVPGAGAETDEIVMRFEILQNRLGILSGGDVAAFTDRRPDQKAVVESFGTALAAVEPLIARIGEPGMPAAILHHLTPIERKLTQFAAAANQYSGSLMADDQRTLLELHRIFSAVAACLVVCGLGFIGLLLFQQRMIGRAHDELRVVTEDLHRAKDEAEAASEAKSRFLANMSHELRTPLNAIIGFSDFIASETLGPVNPPKYRDYVCDILRSGTHMFELVNDILTMAKLDAGHFELALEELEVDRVAEDVLTMFRGTEMARDRRIELAMPPDLPRLSADHRALRQMLLNLLSNAAKFSEKDTSLRIACTADAEGLRLSVADRGIGMTAEQVALAVQPFQQIDNRLTRKYEGTGLGLSIVKALMERHGGALVIDSVPGRGTTATLVFPATLTRAMALPAAA
jgi:signal transduction histidine kinase